MANDGDTSGHTNGQSTGQKGNPNGSTDPSVYQKHYEAFKEAGLPSKPEAWLQRAAQVAAILAEDVAVREKENKSPFAEVALLKSSGLTKALGPPKYGGGGQSWDVAYKLIREVSKGDSSIGMLLGYHLLWSRTSSIVGTDEQNDRIQKLIIGDTLFIGGAVNPRNEDQKITDDGDHIMFNGFKHFNTGGVVSDLTVLEGVLEGTDKHIFAVAPSKQPGLQFQHNWDNVGLRLSESGSVKIENVRLPWSEALGWDHVKKKPLEGILKIPYATLQLPTIQLVFSNLYIGIALGALSSATMYTTKHTRPWPYTPHPVPTGTSEPYILQRYGSFFAHLRAAETLANEAGSRIAAIYAAHSAHRDVTTEQRGEVAEWVASVKVVATDTALRVTGGLFEVMGASATRSSLGLDRFWRDVRTHTLHDPVAYKEQEFGRYVLKGEVPEPSWYT